MFAGTALSVCLFVCAGLSLFIICGPYLSVVVCVLYAYNLTIELATFPVVIEIRLITKTQCLHTLVKTVNHNKVNDMK